MGGDLPADRRQPSRERFLKASYFKSHCQTHGGNAALSHLSGYCALRLTGSGVFLRPCAGCSGVYHRLASLRVAQRW
jgi:hypothetical protein